MMVGLGRVHHSVSTRNPEAQAFFNQGLAYIYAFNHAEAVRSFKRAAELEDRQFVQLTEANAKMQEVLTHNSLMLERCANALEKST